MADFRGPYNLILAKTLYSVPGAQTAFCVRLQLIQSITAVAALSGPSCHSRSDLSFAVALAIPSPLPPSAGQFGCHVSQTALRRQRQAARRRRRLSVVGDDRRRWADRRRRWPRSRQMLQWIMIWIIGRARTSYNAHRSGVEQSAVTRAVVAAARHTRRLSLHRAQRPAE